MGKIIKSVFAVAAFAFATVASGGTFLGISALSSAALAGGAIGGVLGVLSSLVTPKKEQVQEQAGTKLPVYNAADSRKIIYGRQRVAGTEIFVEEYDSNGNNDVPNDTLVLARVVADHPITSFGQFWIGDQKIDFAADANQSVANSGNATTAKYQNKLYLRTHNGTQTSWDGRLGQASGLWTTAHVGNGVAYYTLKANFDNDVFPYGAGEFRNCSIEVDGKPVYDPRNGAHNINDPATWEFSTNPALCIYDYLRDDVLGNPVPDIEINTDAIISAANICDELVAVSGGGTIKRYTLNGMVDSGRDKFSNVQTMLSAMGGRIMWLGGEIHIFAASERTSTHLLDEDVIISAQFDPMPPAESRFNEVRGTFISPAENFEPQDFPPLIDTVEQALEGERAQSLNLPYTQDHRIAQRLSKIALYNSRQPLLSVEALPAAAAFAPMDVISVSWANFGLVGEDFRIISQSINGGSGTQPATVNLTLMREEASVYAWNELTEEQPRGTKPALKVVDPSISPAPTGVLVSSETLTSLDGSKQTSLRVSWAMPYTTVAATYVDYRVTGTGTWLPAGSSTRGDTDLRLLLPSSQSYEVQVRHLYMNGNFSLPVVHAARSTDTLPGADRMVHRGDYSALTEYGSGDVVASGGSSYLFIGTSPATGIAVSNTAYWALLASVGGFYDILFKRAAAQPATPTGNSPAGWTDGPPTADGNPLWMIKGRKDSFGVLQGTWTTPQEVGGSGVEIEYSANGSTGWHAPPFISGTDVYMRQRLSGEADWSAAIRIVGEAGAAGSDGADGANGATGPMGPAGPAGPAGTGSAVETASDTTTTGAAASVSFLRHGTGAVKITANFSLNGGLATGTPSPWPINLFLQRDGTTITPGVFKNIQGYFEDYGLAIAYGSHSATWVDTDPGSGTTTYNLSGIVGGWTQSLEIYVEETYTP